MYVPAFSKSCQISAPTSRKCQDCLVTLGPDYIFFCTNLTRASHTRKYVIPIWTFSQGHELFIQVEYTSILYIQ